MSTHSSQPRWISRKTPVGRHHLASRRFDLHGAFLHASSWEVLVTKIGEMRGLCRAQPALNCPAILVLEFSSTGSDSPIALYPGGWEGSTSCLSIINFSRISDLFWFLKHIYHMSDLQSYCLNMRPFVLALACGDLFPVCSGNPWTMSFI